MFVPSSICYRRHERTEQRPEPDRDESPFSKARSTSRIQNRAAELLSSCSRCVDRSEVRRCVYRSEVRRRVTLFVLRNLRTQYSNKQRDYIDHLPASTTPERCGLGTVDT